MKLRLPIIMAVLLFLANVLLSFTGENEKYNEITSDTHQVTMPHADIVRIAEFFNIAEAFRDDIWNHWSSAPFALLLITPDHEFLIRHPEPSADFEPAGYDSLLQSMVYVRPRVFPPNLLASFPAVGGIPTIVIGQPEPTGKSSTFWVLTALHEHFHQFQSSQPDYYASVNALGLSGGDQTGQWMLNYPFPYESPDVADRFDEWSLALHNVLQQAGTPEFEESLASYFEKRTLLREALDENDYQYMSFQIWQEGVARYTEYKIAETASAHYIPSAEFRLVDDFIPFPEAADELYGNIMEGLSGPSLQNHKRVAFYSVGAAEALLLDMLNPDWKKQYFEKKFDLAGMQRDR